MEFSRPLLEVAGLIVSLALVGLVLSRSRETATVVESTAGAFGSLLSISMNAGNPISTQRYR